MRKIKILNLYACLGGNRYKWDEVYEKRKHSTKNTLVMSDITPFNNQDDQTKIVILFYEQDKSI